MKKVLLFGAALALICGAGFATAASAQEDLGPEHIVITDGTATTMNPAYFPHRAHQSFLKDCGICHHGKTADGQQEKYAAGASQQLKCSACHNKTADGSKLEGKPAPVVGISPIQRAGHGLCHGCHQKDTSKSTKEPAVNLMECQTCHTKK